MSSPIYELSGVHYSFVSVFYERKLWTAIFCRFVYPSLLMFTSIVRRTCEIRTLSSAATSLADYRQIALATAHRIQLTRMQCDMNNSFSFTLFILICTLITINIIYLFMRIIMHHAIQIQCAPFKYVRMFSSRTSGNSEQTPGKKDAHTSDSRMAGDKRRIWIKFTWCLMHARCDALNSLFRTHKYLALSANARTRCNRRTSSAMHKHIRGKWWI